jgi:hypothetical protein
VLEHVRILEKVGATPIEGTTSTRSCMLIIEDQRLPTKFAFALHLQHVANLKRIPRTTLYFSNPLRDALEFLNNSTKIISRKQILKLGKRDESQNSHVKSRN